MQTYDQSDIGDSTIRSSKLKCFEGCQYLYFESYVRGVPQRKNSGSEKGQICHDLLEILGKPKHREIYNLIIKNGSIYSYKPIDKLVKHYIKNSETLKPIPETLDHINLMMKTGLTVDFFVPDEEIIAQEYKFEIENKSPSYKIKGFMDKISVKGDQIIIRDFKSSKKVYQGSDKESNGQALLYLVAAKKLWPDKKGKVIFIFLAHPDSPLLECEFSDDVLAGYEIYLEESQKKLNNVTEKNSLVSLAAHKPMPTDGSFTGPLLCGFSRYKGQLKKDSSLMYACPIKWPFDYYIISKNGKTIYSSLHDNVKLKRGEIIEKRTHLGCPAFRKNSILNDFNVAPKIKFDPLSDF